MQQSPKIYREEWRVHCCFVGGKSKQEDTAIGSTYLIYLILLSSTDNLKMFNDIHKLTNLLSSPPAPWVEFNTSDRLRFRNCVQLQYQAKTLFDRIWSPWCLPDFWLADTPCRGGCPWEDWSRRWWSAGREAPSPPPWNTASRWTVRRAECAGQKSRDGSLKKKMFSIIALHSIADLDSVKAASLSQIWNWNCKKGRPESNLMFKDYKKGRKKLSDLNSRVGLLRRKFF